jgi:integrase
MREINVNLTKRVNTDNGWRFCKVVVNKKNQSVKPNWVIVKGVPEEHPEGAYYIDWRIGTKRIRESVGNDSGMAVEAQKDKERELEGYVKPGAVAPGKSKASAGTDLAATIAEYLKQVERDKHPDTFESYSRALEQFTTVCKKKYMEEIKEEDFLYFFDYLKKRGNKSATIANKFIEVRIFMNAYGFANPVRRNNRPKPLRKNPVIYEDADLEKLLAAATDSEKPWLLTYLTSGLRKNELNFLYWSDLHFDRKMITVTAKPEWNPKKMKERQIPMQPHLVPLLLKWKESTPFKDSKLVFPMSEGPRKGKPHRIAMLKAIAKRAGLDPKLFWLHKFRSTFTTKILQGGELGPTNIVHVKTVLGHDDIKTTMRYVDTLADSNSHAKMTSAFDSIFDRTGVKTKEKEIAELERLLALKRAEVV